MGPWRRRQANSHFATNNKRRKNTTPFSCLDTMKTFSSKVAQQAGHVITLLLSKRLQKSSSSHNIITKRRLFLSTEWGNRNRQFDALWHSPHILGDGSTSAEKKSTGWHKELLKLILKQSQKDGETRSTALYGTAAGYIMTRRSFRRKEKFLWKWPFCRRAAASAKLQSFGLII